MTFLITLAHPDNHLAQITFGTTLFWFGPSSKRSLWYPGLDLPRHPSEFAASHVSVFRSYRILTIVWIIFAFLVIGLFTENPYRSETWWHAPCGAALWGMAVLSVNLPKAMLIWNMPDDEIGN